MLSLLRRNAACLLVVLAACGEQGSTPAQTAEQDASPRAKTTWRLFDELPPEVIVRGEARAPIASHPLLPAVGDDRWFALRPHQTARGLRLGLATREGPGGSLVLGTAEGPAQLVATGVRPGEALIVRAQVRVEGPPPTTDWTVAAVEERRSPVAADDELSLEDVRLLFASGGGLLVHPASAGNATAEISLPLLLGPETTELVVYLAAPLQARSSVHFEEVQLFRSRASDHLRSGAPVSGAEPRHDALGTVDVSLDLDRRTALALVPGTRLTWTLPELPPDSAWRLDHAVGLRPRTPEIDGMLGLSWFLDGEAVHVENLEAPHSPDEPAWRERSMRLARAPSDERPGTLELRVEGLSTDDPPAAWLAQPLLRAVPGPRGPAGEPPGDRPADTPPHIVLISLDTLRFDRLGCYGNDDGLTPRIDALAAHGLRFASAWSTSSYTLPSHASLLTGTLPVAHGAESMSSGLDPERSPFLARILAEAGYHTAAFTGGGFVAPSFGFSEGFDRYAEVDPVWALDARRGMDLLQRHGGGPGSRRQASHRRLMEGGVADWITAQPHGAPFFLFLHTYITHSLAPSRAALQRFGLLGPDGEEAPIDHRATSAFNDGARERLDEARASTLPYYDATVTMADALVGAVLDALDAAGLSQDTIVVVTSDHGEEFGEHDHFGHGRSLYEPVARVPLIVRLPAHLRGERQPGVVPEPVSLVDVAPWILRLAGLTPDPRMTPPPPFAPETLDPPRRRVVPLDLHTSYARESALVRDGLKLHLRWRHENEDLGEPATLLFDLRADPAEHTELSAAREDDVATLQHAIVSYREQRDETASRERDLDPETRRALRQLGYLDAEDDG